MEEREKIYQINVDDILPNRFQPRLAFDEDELNSLSSSIKKYGVLQPIIVRKIGEKYEIVAGERRYKATVLAGLKTIPAIINNTDDNTSAEIALLENLQRKNLTVIEEAKSFKKLLEKHFTQEEIATKLGISQSSIANKIRLLNLPKKVQDALLYNKISERHARSLLAVDDIKIQEDLLDRIINEKLTVRQAEEEINKLLNKTVKEDIPEDIKKYIDSTNYDDKKEKFNFINNKFVRGIPEVLNIDDNSEEDLIEQSEHNLEAKTDIINNYFDNIRINNDILKTPKFMLNTESEENIIIYDYKETISDIRQYLKTYDSSKVKINEHDLPQTYKIVIEIKKDAY